MRLDRRPQSGHRAARRVVTAARWSVSPSHHTRSTRTPGTVGKNSLVSMACPAFLQRSSPSGASGYRHVDASKAPKSHLHFGAYSLDVTPGTSTLLRARIWADG